MRNLVLTLLLAFGAAAVQQQRSAPLKPVERPVVAPTPRAVVAPAATIPERGRTIWTRTVNDPISLYTFLLTVLTGLLAAVGLIQIRYLIRSDETARIAANAASESARAASASVAGMAEQHEVMQGQMRAMRDIADGVSASAQVSKEAVEGMHAMLEISKRQLVANNLPVLELYDVLLDMSTDKWAIQFSLVNTGNTAATVVELLAYDDWMGLERDVPTAPSFVAVPKVSDGQKLVPGEPLSCVHLCTTEEMALYGIAVGNDMAENASLYFILRVDFADDNGTRHLARFPRAYDRSSRRYLPPK